jgi:diguanylate cyclase (GGDEF)-like protein
MSMTRLSRLAWALAACVLGAYAILAVTGAGGDRHELSTWVYNGMVAFAAAACVVRCVREPRERRAWAVLSLALLAWLGGDVYHSLYLDDATITPFPSVSDGFFVVFYPACFAAIVLLVRRRVRPIGPALLLDGIISALAVCSVVAALTFNAALAPLVDSAGTAAIAFNLAYPLGDLALLGSVAAVMSLTGWRPGRALGTLACGLVIVALGDTIFLLQSFTGAYTEGSWVDVLWPAGLLLTAFAAWQPVRPVALEMTGRRVLSLPILFSLTALAVIAAQQVTHVNRIGLALATATILAAIVRMAWSLRSNLQLLAATREEATSDVLTGLGNRRRLMLALEEVLEVPEHANHLLLLFDLDGFKSYNDTFGHLEGDALLGRRARALSDSIGEHGCAYRLGGDEFCVLMEAGSPGMEALVTACCAALSERGEGYEIRPSWGGVLLPEEAGTTHQALAVADQRMYNRKRSRRASARRQSTDVLVGVMKERDGDLGDHSVGVAELVHHVGERLGMTPDELDEMARAAELHDIGKVSIPESVLHKPAALDLDEWALMHKHTIVGERILSAAPALIPIARLVRASHERWDGDGYPDGLRGHAIPLGARVISVCDAFDAMVADRPYQPSMNVDDAIAELRRCAGSQFDPEVVEAFCEVLGRRHRRTPARTGAPEPGEVAFVARVGDVAEWLGATPRQGGLQHSPGAANSSR